MNLIQKFAGTGWGAKEITLRTSIMAIVYSTHVSRIDSQLNNSMRIISDTIKSTQTQWLQGSSTDKHNATPYSEE